MKNSPYLQLLYILIALYAIAGVAFFLISYFHWNFNGSFPELF